MKVVDEKHPWSDVRMGRRGGEMGLPSTGLRSVALLLPISEAKPRSTGRSRELSYFVVPEKGHGSWYEVGRDLKNQEVRGDSWRDSRCW